MRLAFALLPSKSYTSTQLPDELERKDTLATVEFGDPVLDPSKPEFDVYKWAHMLMRTMDEEGVKARRAGFTFKHLNGSGSGSALNLQKNVGSVFHGPVATTRAPGIPQEKMLKEFKGEVAYNKEVDQHFPHLTVGQTLEFAAAARTHTIE
ncbi:MAG: hypothetical protein M1830_000973 [Pleopsidium flavum]|nr:MAG: hypothetical protein M1830_000973 [Pleopsidium flavum]